MSRRAGIVVRASQGLLGLFVLAVLLEHVFQPRLTPGTHRISEYANGSPGWLMTAGFAAWSLALAGTAASVVVCGLRPRRAVLGLSLLVAVAAVGAGVTASVNTGTSAGVVPAGHHLTAANHVHDLGSGVLALALWAGVLVSLIVRSRPLRAVSGGVLALGVPVAVVLSAGLVDLPGVSQRALVAVACAWQFVLLAVAAHPLRSATGREP